MKIIVDIGLGSISSIMKHNDECGVKSFDWIAQQLKKSEVPVTDNKKAENNPSQAVKTEILLIVKFMQ